ncbi:MAG: hypothetical protein H0V60_05860, partial [Actinobacteria bacterium]|nr:hypothetical protein [Actinomycetota bacterium]
MLKLLHPPPWGVKGACVCLLAALTLMACEAGGAPTPQAKPLVDAPSYDTNDPVKRACGLEKEWLVRIWRGYHGSRSENITMVHAKPN